MAVRQYVGARYVPKFADPVAWQAGTSYEALTIVTYNNSSYTSKVPVPATVGNPADNDTYWALTGNYNAQVEAYREEAVAVQENLTEEIQNRENADQQLQSAIDLINIDKTEVILFGDSWVDYNSDPTHVNIPERLSNGLGLNVHNYSHGGTGFDVALGYDAQLQEFRQDTSFDHNKVKYCILVAGLNEYNPQTTAASFRDKLQDWVDKAKALTSAPIYWFFDYSMVNDIRDTLSRTFAPQRDYFNTVANNLHRDITCVNMMGWVEWSQYANNWNTDNYYHPNYNGSYAVGQNMVRILKGYAPIIYPYAFIRGTWENTGNPNLSHTDVLFTMEGGQLFATFITPTDAIGTPDHYGYDVTFAHNLPANIPTQTITIATNLYITKGSTEGSASLGIPHHDETIASPSSGYTITGRTECAKLGS